MNMLNLTFNSIVATKNNPPKGKINVVNNVNIDNVEDANIGVDKTNTTMKVSFTFTTNYQPDYAKIELKGNLIVLETKENAAKVLKAWQKDKKLAKEFSIPVMNLVMSRCGMQVIVMAKELTLPSPFPMPKVNLAPEPAKKK